MKPSHLHTPRTLADTTFTTGYSSTKRQTGYSAAWWAVITVLSVVAFVVVVTGAPA